MRPILEGKLVEKKTTRCAICGKKKPCEKVLLKKKGRNLDLTWSYHEPSWACLECRNSAPWRGNWKHA